MTTQLMKQNDTKVNGLKALLAEQGIKNRFEEMLGKRAPAFLSSIMSSVSANPALAEAEPMSVISAAAIAASMELPITPSLGFSHIVPYKGKAQFQIGWKGFVQLAMRSGQYKTINITPVLEGQIKSHNPFTGEMEFSVESISQKQVGYLLYFKLLNGYEKYFYMTTEKVREHGMEYSASFKKNYGMWVDDFESMALKTVAKLGLSKYGILSVEMQKAVEFDQATVEANGEPKYVDNETQPVANAAPVISRVKVARSTDDAQKAAQAAQTQAPAEEPAQWEQEVEKAPPLTQPAGPTRNELGAEIVSAARAKGLAMDAVVALAKQHFNGKAPEQLTIEEMQGLLTFINAHSARRN